MADPQMRRLTIRSGGQTGVDRAALDVALALGISVTGWCPRGRLAEDGTIPERYPLRETDSVDYAHRTRRNVRDSDATLVLRTNDPSPGTDLTERIAHELGKPLLVVFLDDHEPDKIRSWLTAVRPGDLNVAGPRESEAAGIYVEALRPMRAVLGGAASRPSALV